MESLDQRIKRVTEEEINIEPYNLTWPSMFTQEKEYLLSRTKIVFVNASLSKIDKLASNAKRRLVRAGFPKGNIFTEDSKSKVDKTYAYYRRPEHKQLLGDILFELYKVRSSPYIDITLAEEAKNTAPQQNLWVANEGLRQMMGLASTG